MTALIMADGFSFLSISAAIISIYGLQAVKKLMTVYDSKNKNLS